MKLKLDKPFKKEIVSILTGVLFDVIDGDIDSAEMTARALETLAAQIRKQNERATNIQGLVSELPEGLH